jgi:plastocyanin
MRRAILAVVAAGALALPASASADVFAVSMPGKYFDPQRLTVVVGDQVTWRNADFVSHEVRATNGAFDSGPLARSAVFAHTFDTAGAYGLVCPIHPFMSGQVDVVGATLSASQTSVVDGETVTLSGRAPAGSGSVALEEQGAGGAWTQVASTGAGADGAFSLSMPAHDAASYRAVSSAGASPAVAIHVTARVELEVMVHHGKVMVQTKPRQKRLVATLQIYSRERFTWRRIGHAKTNKRGAATFRVRRGMRGTVRVVLSRVERGAALGISHALRLRDGRMVADPLPKPAPRGGHGGHH